MIDLFVGLVALGLGVYLGMEYKDTLQKWWYGAQAFAKMLEDKAAAVKAAVK